MIEIYCGVAMWVGYVEVYVVAKSACNIYAAADAVASIKAKCGRGYL